MIYVLLKAKRVEKTTSDFLQKKMEELNFNAFTEMFIFHNFEL